MQKPRPVEELLRLLLAVLFGVVSALTCIRFHWPEWWAYIFVTVAFWTFTWSFPRGSA